jgi:hypothetical protein
MANLYLDFNEVYRISYNTTYCQLNGSFQQILLLLPTGWSQYIRCGLSRSSTTSLIYGVPQRSVLGPVLSILYTTDLKSLTERHGFSPHLYAGSRQPTVVEAFSSKICGCVSAIASWMKSNRLQLHADKTEVLWRATGWCQYQPSKCRSIRCQQPQCHLFTL